MESHSSEDLELSDDTEACAAAIEEYQSQNKHAKALTKAIVSQLLADLPASFEGIKVLGRVSAKKWQLVSTGQYKSTVQFRMDLHEHKDEYFLVVFSDTHLRRFLCQWFTPIPTAWQSYAPYFTQRCDVSAGQDLPQFCFDVAFRGITRRLNANGGLLRQEPPDVPSVAFEFFVHESAAHMHQRVFGRKDKVGYKQYNLKYMEADPDEHEGLIRELVIVKCSAAALKANCKANALGENAPRHFTPPTFAIIHLIWSDTLRDWQLAPPLVHDSKLYYYPIDFGQRFGRSGFTISGFPMPSQALVPAEHKKSCAATSAITEPALGQLMLQIEGGSIFHSNPRAEVNARAAGLAWPPPSGQYDLYQCFIDVMSSME